MFARLWVLGTSCSFLRYVMFSEHWEQPVENVLLKQNGGLVLPGSNGGGPLTQCEARRLSAYLWINFLKQLHDNIVYHHNNH